MNDIEGFYEFYQMDFVFRSMKMVMKENKLFKRYLMKWVVSPHIDHSDREMIKERLHTLRVMVKSTIFNVLANTHDLKFKGLLNLLRKIRADASKNVNLCKLISSKPTT